MKIVFTGSGSTGKSTLLRELQKDPRFKDYKFFDSITKTAQDMGLKINTEGEDSTQKAIMSIHEEVLKNDNFIASRCSLDCISYTVYLYNHGNISQSVFDELYDKFLELVKQYDLIFYIKPEFKPKDNGLRSTDQHFIDEVAENFEEIIQRENLNVHTLHGTVEERMSQIYGVLNV